MLNFKKVFNFKLISMLTVVMLLLTSAAHCAEPYQKTSLRIPLDFNNKSAADNRWQDALRSEELGQLKGILNDPFLDLDEENIDFIIQDISKRGGLFIDADGAIHGSKSTLRMLSEMRKVTMGELLQESLFHEGVHKLLQLILYSEPKKLFLQEIGDELGAGYSFRSASLKNDMINIMREAFGEFESENEYLEELIAKYYTYKFCGRDADIFNLPEMQRAGLIIESKMGGHYYDIADDSSRTKKNLDTLFSIKGEKTKKARNAKLKELSTESEKWGGKFDVTFEERDEAVARLDKALGRLFLKNYPIITVLRRMRHGGSVYDMETRVNTIQFLDLIAMDCPPAIGEKILSLHGYLKDEFAKLRQLTNEPPKNIGATALSDEILKDWEYRLVERAAAFKIAQKQFGELKKQISEKSFDKESAEHMSAMFEEGLKSGTSVLEQGVDFTKGIVSAKTTNPNESIKKAIEPYNRFAEFRETSVPDIQVDPMMLHQMIANIIVNADTLKIKAEITKVLINTKLSDDGKEVIIEIIDNGLGFNKNMLSNRQETDGSYEVVFGYGVTYRDGGSGFGLAENDLYAKLNNGSFQVFTRSSGEHRGSTFVIRLPVSRINEQPAQETESAIIERMKQSIASLMTSWRANPPTTNAMGQALSPEEATAEKILGFFFRDDKVSNKLGIVRLYLETSQRGMKPRKDSVILSALNFCSALINKFDNAQIEMLQDDAELKEYAEYLLEHPNVHYNSITKEQIKNMNVLKPEQIRAMLQRYIDELKPVIASLKENLNKLMQVSPGDTAAIEQIKELQTSL